MPRHAVHLAPGPSVVDVQSLLGLGGVVLGKKRNFSCVDVDHFFTAIIDVIWLEELKTLTAVCHT